jgi:hypothetical protein
MTDLILCSRCKCKKLPEFYTIRKNTGLRYKTCINCCDNKIKCNECHLYFTNKGLQKHIDIIHLNKNIEQIKKDKRKIYKKNYNELNKDKIKVYRKEYNEAHKEHIKKNRQIRDEIFYQKVINNQTEYAYDKYL